MKLDINSESELLLICESYEDNSSQNPLMGIKAKSRIRDYFDDLHKIKISYIEIEKGELVKDCREEIYNIITNNSIKRVILCGRRLAMVLFPSYVHRNMNVNDLLGRPFTAISELPIIVGFNHHYSIVDGDSEDITKSNLIDYYSNFSALFEDRPKYVCNVEELKTEKDLIQTLIIMDSLPNNVKLGLDYETNAAIQFSVDYKTTCIGLAYQVDGLTAQCYWYYIEGVLSNNAREAFKLFIDRNYNRIWTFNCSFEIKSTWHELGKFYEFQDAMVLMTMMNKRTSLKNIVRAELGSTMWEADLQYFLNKTSQIFIHLQGVRIKDRAMKCINEKDWVGLSEISTKLKEYVDWITEDYPECDLSFIFKNYPYQWATAPRNILGPYCAQDAGYTVLLVDKFWEERWKPSYDFCIKHQWLCAKFEVNGVMWDDNIANELYLDLGKQMLDRLYYIITHLNGVSQSDKLKAKDIYYSELPYEVVWYTEKQNKERRYSVNTNYDKIEELKKIFSPGSNTTDNRNLFWNSYLNDDIKLATVLNIFNETLELFGTHEEFEAALPKGFWDRDLTQILVDLSEPARILKDQPKSLVKDVLNAISTAASTYEDKLYKLQGALIKGQYKAHKKWLGLNIEDESTWDDSWKLLFNLFLYKKLDKTQSANIRGEMGRSSCSEILGTIYNGISVRGRKYYDIPSDQLKDKKFILNTTFNPLAADTLRWTSFFHTIPPGNPCRRALIPRANDMLLVHTDFSQQELVCLAAVCGDENMIEAFKNRVDMHRYVASLVFDKTVEQVTSAERSMAKTVVFGLLYGKGVESLAKDAMGGDVELATRVVGLFFDRFPKIKTWIDARHKEVDEKGYVLSHFGNILRIDTTQRGNAKYRNAQNAPIQFLGSAMAGNRMYDFTKACEDSGIITYPFGFVHDALDDCTPANTIIEYIELIQYVLSTRTYELFKFPANVDYEIGADGLGLCDLIINSKRGNVVNINIKGREDYIENILAIMSRASAYSLNNINKIEAKESFVSWEELFTVGKALKDNWGKTIVNSTINLDLVYKDKVWD